MSHFFKMSRVLQMIAFLVGAGSILSGVCCTHELLTPKVVSAEENPDRPRKFDHSHHKFDSILKQFVIDGRVDYKGILKESGLFYEYLDSLDKVEMHAFESWTKSQRLAFWINAYNAFTIQAVIERYPIKSRSLIGLFTPENSILQISGVWTRLKFAVGGSLFTLDQIEHDIIRKRFGDARIHFAIVCASRSCPVLRSEAYNADVLESQLEQQAVMFINDPARGVRLDAGKRRLYLSKIFKWFESDFKNAARSESVPVDSQFSANPLLVYIRPYLKNRQLKEILDEGKKIRISYLDYDWRLNDLNETRQKVKMDSNRND